MPIFIDTEELIKITTSAPVPSVDSVDNVHTADVIGNKEDAAAVPSNTTSVVAIIKKIYASCVGFVTGLLVLTETGGTVTTDGTEQNVYINDAPAGVYSPRLIQIDFTNQTAAETVIIREYYRIKAGGALIKTDETTFAGVQDPLLKGILLKDNRFGVNVTIEKTAGANKAYDYEAIYKV